MNYSKDCKYNSFVIEDKMLIIIIVEFEGAYVTWESQVRFVRVLDQPNIVNMLE